MQTTIVNAFHYILHTTILAIPENENKCSTVSVCNVISTLNMIIRYLLDVTCNITHVAKCVDNGCLHVCVCDDTSRHGYNFN